VHALYEKQRVDSGFHFKFKEPRSLAGKDRGMIPHLLEVHLNGSGSEPLPWHFIIEDELIHGGWPNCTLIINLKPNDAGGNLSLYEVVEAWGWSQSGWTPIMLHLRGLITDEDSGACDPHDFIRKKEDLDDPIFTMIYMNGTVQNGELGGGWNFPPPSSTNSVLLWPKTFEYFAEEARKCILRLS
jgi:hypothetical protein